MNNYNGLIPFIVEAASALGVTGADVSAKVQHDRPLVRLSSQVASACAARPESRREILSHAYAMRDEIRVALEAADRILAWSEVNLMGSDADVVHAEHGGSLVEDVRKPARRRVEHNHRHDPGQ